MSMQQDCTDRIQAQLRHAYERGTPLRICAGGSKGFYGRKVSGERLEVGDHQGILNYEPKELVLTARAGTPLRRVEQTLAEQGQMLPFEPPHFGATATYGGTVATGLSGPRRPYAGAVRDHVLGVRVLNGRAEQLHFGGEMMKNVAGYDLSRLMVGAQGTLGVLLDISVKVLPLPECAVTLSKEVSAQEAVDLMNRFAARALPLDGACHDGERLHLRCSGTAKAVNAAAKRIGGEQSDGERFWRELREQQLGFFSGQGRLWRLSIAAASPYHVLPGKQLIDWGGAQRWLVSDAESHRIRRYAQEAGGHATLFRAAGDENTPFHPLAKGVDILHQRVKQALDPAGILNPGRVYEGL